MRTARLSRKCSARILRRILALRHIQAFCHNCVIRSKATQKHFSRQMSLLLSSPFHSYAVRYHRRVFISCGCECFRYVDSNIVCNLTILTILTINSLGIERQIIAQPSCKRNCTWTAREATAWSWSSLTVSTTIVAARVVVSINTDVNTTVRSTEFLTLPSGFTIPETNSLGTHVTTFSAVTQGTWKEIVL
jgi:hypothetical protein